jgi:hypothetical protein
MANKTNPFFQRSWSGKRAYQLYGELCVFFHEKLLCRHHNLQIIKKKRKKLQEHRNNLECYCVLNYSYCSCTWTPESYVPPAVQFCGIVLVGTSHFWSLPCGAPLLNSILTDRGPLGGETAAHTAPWVRLEAGMWGSQSAFSHQQVFRTNNFNLSSHILPLSWIQGILSCPKFDKMYREEY